MSYNTRRQAGQGGGKCEGSDIERKMVVRVSLDVWFEGLCLRDVGERCCKFCNKYG
jgi:hypothetical protein